MENINIKEILTKAFSGIINIAKDYELLEKCKNIIEKSGVLDELKKQISDFALIAVYQAEYAFNKIGAEKKQLAFQMVYKFIKYPIALKPFKRLIEKLLYDFASDKIEEAVLKLKEHLKNEIR